MSRYQTQAGSGSIGIRSSSSRSSRNGGIGDAREVPDEGARQLSDGWPFVPGPEQAPARPDFLHLDEVGSPGPVLGQRQQHAHLHFRHEAGAEPVQPAPRDAAPSRPRSGRPIGSPEVLDEHSRTSWRIPCLVLTPAGDVHSRATRLLVRGAFTAPLCRFPCGLSPRDPPQRFSSPRHRSAHRQQPLHSQTSTDGTARTAADPVVLRCSPMFFPLVPAANQSPTGL